MRGIRWLVVSAGGVLAGIVGALAMILVLLTMRTWLGISPPFESLPDRFAPTLDIPTFFSLFGRFGGYNGLKRFGIQSGLAGMLAAGLLAGLAYAWVTERARSRPGSRWRWGVSRDGVVFVLAAAGVLWIASLVVLWPVLFANFRGLPPETARLVTALGLLLAYAVYGIGLVLTYRLLTGPGRGPVAVAPGVGTPAVPLATPAAALAGAVLGAGAPAALELGPLAGQSAAPTPGVVGRRAVIAVAAGAALAVPAVALLRRLNAAATFSYDGLAYSGPGIQPIAPNDKFYTVTKNVVDPNVDRGVWRLDVNGLVDRPTQYDYARLAALPALEQESTLMCISNRIGAGLFSNAVWRGVPMADLLEEAGVRPGAVEVLLRGADGFTDTFAIEKALDPTTLVVYEMNGDPLPERHGYPVRIVVPGLYGEKNVKWITGIEVVDHDAKGFYEQQGWGPNFTVPTRSDFFSPKVDDSRQGFLLRDTVPVGEPIELRGRAFAGDRGVRAVEISTDDGESWQPVRIDYPGTRLTWTFWSFRWRPEEPGEFFLVSRATDGDGVVQPPDKRGIVPQGATGYHRVRATVVA
jgi:DMSO/TMAO reductase YedYZ molybdopterin-dependent catalytic subunit